MEIDNEQAVGILRRILSSQESLLSIHDAEDLRMVTQHLVSELFTRRDAEVYDLRAQIEELNVEIATLRHSNPGPAEPSAVKRAVEICEAIGCKWATAEGTYNAGKKAGAFECAETLRRDLAKQLLSAPAASSVDDGVKCKTCKDKRVIGDPHDIDTGEEPCPDCTPNTREEKQAKCETCGLDEGRVCDRAYYNPATGTLFEFCLNWTATGYCCGHSRDCHKGDTE